MAHYGQRMIFDEHQLFFFVPIWVGVADACGERGRALGCASRPDRGARKAGWVSVAVVGL